MAAWGRVKRKIRRFETGTGSDNIVPAGTRPLIASHLRECRHDESPEAVAACWRWAATRRTVMRGTSGLGRVMLPRRAGCGGALPR